MPAPAAAQRPPGEQRRRQPGRHRGEPVGFAGHARRVASRLRTPKALVIAIAGVVLGAGAVVGTGLTADRDGTATATGSVVVSALADQPAATGGDDAGAMRTTTRSRLAVLRRELATRVSRGTGREALEPARDRPLLSPLQRQAAAQARQRVAALGVLTQRAAERADRLAERRAAERAAQRAAERAAQRAAERAAQRAAERAAARWVLPVSDYSLSAGFGAGGDLWSSGSHTGLDLAAPEGTPIVAVTGGVVTTAGYSAQAGWAGNLVVVRLEDRSTFWYAHQSSVAVDVGDTVAPGQVVGYVGSTGNSTGPHLHLEVQVRGEPVDPVQVLGRHGLTP